MSKRPVAPLDKAPPLQGLQPLTSLSKGLKVLLRLREATEPMSLSEISRTLGLNKVTVLRLLITLEKFRFVERDPQQKKYRIGSNAFYVGSGFIAEGKQKKIFQVMVRLVRDLKHTITLSVLDGSSVLFVERVDGTERVKVTVDIGSRVPAYSSAAGKAMLSALTDQEIRERLKRTKFQRVTSKTLTSIERILARIHKVRDSGFATNDEESTPGLFAIAVPLKDQAGATFAGLGVAFPTGVLNTKEEQKKVARRLWKAAEEIKTFGGATPGEISSMAS
jgi:DNA-binding IclR family transcriptional regulator